MKLHTYEIEITDLYKRAWHFLGNTLFSHFIKGNHGESAKESLKTFFEWFYKQNELDQNSTAIVVEAGDPEYNTFMGVSLSTIDPFLIPRFLDYHKSKYSIGDFIGAVEFQIYGMMDVIPVKNFDRRERVMNWVIEQRKSVAPAIVIKKKPDKEIRLAWHPGFMSALKKLTKRLWKEKFTKRQSDFEKVFLEGKPIEWRTDPELLCYLLHKLRSHKPPLYSASKGKGHYQLAATLFIDVSRKLAKKNYIPDTIYKFKTRHIGKPIPERVLIDNMIKFSVGN